MSTSFTTSIPPAINEWLDPALLPAYLIAGTAMFFTVRYVDNKWIRPPSKTGFGKGAPGFITNTRKLKVTPEIAARLRRGEQVSPEEIDAAVRAAEVKASSPAKTSESEDPGSESPSPNRRSTRSATKKKNASVAKHVEESKPVESDVNEWIPETHLRKGPQRGRKR